MSPAKIDLGYEQLVLECLEIACQLARLSSGLVKLGDGVLFLSSATLQKLRVIFVGAQQFRVLALPALDQFRQLLNALESHVVFGEEAQCICVVLGIDGIAVGTQ